MGTSRREKRKEAWRTFRRTLPDAIALARPYARLWGLGLVLLLVGRAAGLVLPGTPKILMDEVLPTGDLARLNILIGLVLGATLIQGICAFLLTQTISKAGQRLIADLRRRLHDHITRLSVRYFDNHRAGEVVSRVMNDVEGVRNLVGTGMIEFFGGIVTAAFSLAILFWLNWKLTAAIFVFVILLLALMIVAFARLGPSFRKVQEQKAELSARLTESLNGIRVVKAYRTEERERERFGAGVQSLLGTLLGVINTISAVALGSAVLLGALGAIILFIGGRQLINGTLTAGEFISYLLYLGFLIAPVSSIMMVGTQLSEVFAGLERMKQIFSEAAEDANDATRRRVDRIEGRIAFEEVRFAYEENREVLEGISFTADPGSVTALVGPSGSGKSTLMGLVAGFYSPTAGRIVVDGSDLITLNAGDYRRHLGVVLQENFLFSGTIRENLAYIRPDAGEERLREVCRIAHCIEFIDRFPDGLDTVIGERGVKLSGGQRQRLAIARALLADPRILLLDEATSALDSESEAFVQEGLFKLMEGRTTFVIAHRLSTIRRATRILVLEGGRVVESGSHDDLIAARGRYWEMYTRQQGLAGNLFLAPGEEKAAERVDGDGAPPAESPRQKRMEKIGRLIT